MWEWRRGMGFCLAFLCKRVRRAVLDPAVAEDVDNFNAAKLKYVLEQFNDLCLSGQVRVLRAQGESLAASMRDVAQS